MLNVAEFVTDLVLLTFCGPDVSLSCSVSLISFIPPGRTQNNNDSKKYENW